MSALELGRTHLTIDLLVTFAVTRDVALVNLVSSTPEVPAPRWASKVFGMPTLVVVPDRQLIAEVSRRLGL